MNREEVYQGVMNQLNTIPGFVTKSRRLKHWADVPSEQQPALFMMQDVESIETTPTGVPSKSRLSCNLYIYVRLQDEQEPGPILNPLIDAVQNLLNTPHVVTGRNTFNIPGVYWVRVEGQIQIDEGTLDNQAVAIIPVVILVT